MTRPILTLPIGFAPAVVDKVERMLEVLSALRDDPVLRDEFVLHGGTALNIFHARAPRLSVDIDLMFVGAIDVGRMQAKRPEIDGRFRDVVSALGYAVQATNDEHSGQTYRVKYPGDYLKVDISYLGRVALLEPELRVCGFADPQMVFPVLRLEELAAGKVKAMMARMAARDLYDLFRLSSSRPRLFDDPLARALAIRALCAADPFPFLRDPVVAVERFRDQSPEFTEPLLATLPADEALDYGAMLDAIVHWLTPLSSLSSAEATFMEHLEKRAEYHPELLFDDWPTVLERAAVDPVMAWKTLNLQKWLTDSAGLDRRGLVKRPREERNAIIRTQAESVADEYNRQIDHEWLDADLGERDNADE
ncbi:MAG: nucleotidyl transferase AbiEii/AbiGii toxin family protein [Actinomycetota bacterium]|nr:nucleotidyl transferase AbiEii/AbiGii toxin family protein [Actinomycetota bacterium]